MPLPKKFPHLGLHIFEELHALFRFAHEPEALSIIEVGADEVGLRVLMCCVPHRKQGYPCYVSVLSQQRRCFRAPGSGWISRAPLGWSRADLGLTPTTKSRLGLGAPLDSELPLVPKSKPDSTDWDSMRHTVEIQWLQSHCQDSERDWDDARNGMYKTYIVPRA